MPATDRARAPDRGPAPPDVSVVIATLGGPQLARCLAALRAQSGVRFETIVVDGGGQAETAAIVARELPGARVLRLARNGGFAASNNAGLRAARGRWLATLNDDAYPEPDWLRRLVEVGEAEPRVGACASLMLWADRPDTINSTGIALNLAGTAWDRLGGEPAERAGERPVEVFGACAGAALYRRAALAEVGLFAPTFFAYLEDVDLAWRLRAAGWTTLFVPAARVLHEGSRTSDRFPRRKEWLLSRNRVYVLARNYGRWRGPAALAAALWPVAALYDLLSVPWWQVRYWRDFTPLVGRLAGLRRLPRLLRQRARLGRACASLDDLRAVMEPLPAPWAFAQGWR